MSEFCCGSEVQVTQYGSINNLTIEHEKLLKTVEDQKNIIELQNKKICIQSEALDFETNARAHLQNQVQNLRDELIKKEAMIEKQKKLVASMFDMITTG